MRDTSCNNVDSVQVKYGQQAYNLAKQSSHFILRLIVDFWKFSCYYAEYKGRMRGQ